MKSNVSIIRLVTTKSSGIIDLISSLFWNWTKGIQFFSYNKYHMRKKMRIFLRMSDFVHIFLIAYYHSILHSIISLFVRSSLVIDEEKDEYQFGICLKEIWFFINLLPNNRHTFTHTYAGTYVQMCARANIHIHILVSVAINKNYFLMIIIRTYTYE